VIMICSVLVRKMYVIPAQDYGDNLIVPPGRADMTVSHNSRVYVKYNDNDFYPKYFVYYSQRSEHMTESKYFRVNTRQAKDCHDLDAKGYHEDDDCSNELNGVDIYDYLNSKVIYDY